MPTTPNMDLLLPIPTVTLGPTYASENNAAFTTIDSHDHTTGKGVPVPSNGLNINNDLPFNGYNAASLRSARFTSQSAPLSTPSDVSSIYVSNGNLFYNNQLGQQVQITSGAALDATTIGGIGGDYTTSGALLFYTSGTRTFTFWSSTNVPANIDSGSITIRPIATSPAGVTINAPSALSASYSLTLPLALPSTSSALVSDPSGNLSFSPGGNMPTGAIIAYGGVTAPSGYLLCNGTAVSRTTYANLFTAIGTAYGNGDGSTTFNVPQAQGMFLRGADNGAGNDPDTLTRTANNPGGNTGDNVGSQQVDAMTSHTHTVRLYTGSGNISGQAAEAGSAFTSNQNSGTQSYSGGNTVVSTETRPINIYVNYIIKT